MFAMAEKEQCFQTYTKRVRIRVSLHIYLVALTDGAVFRSRRLTVVFKRVDRTS